MAKCLRASAGRQSHVSAGAARGERSMTAQEPGEQRGFPTAILTSDGTVAGTVL